MDQLPKFRQVAEKIRLYIKERDLKTGSRIPSERQLAKEINVSPVTVSKGLGELVDQGFLVRHVGRGTFVAKLAKKGTGRIGVITRYDPFDDYFHGITCGINSFLKGKKYELMVFSRGSDNGGIIKSIKEFSLEGAIFISPLEHSLESIQNLRQNGMPVAIVGSQYETFEDITLSNDDYQSGVDAVNYLNNLGHKRIAIIGKEESPAVNERIKGFQKGMFNNGLPLDPAWILKSKIPTNRDTDSPDLQAIIQVLNSNQAPTAIFATSANILLQVYSAVEHMKLKIPESISVLGFDELPSGNYVSPLPTLFRQPLHELGESAANLVYSEIKHINRPVKNTFHARIIERYSCSKVLD